MILMGGAAAWPPKRSVYRTLILSQSRGDPLMVVASLANPGAAGSGDRRRVHRLRAEPS
jgi:hypothetical protein